MIDQYSKDSGVALFTCFVSGLKSVGLGKYLPYKGSSVYRSVDGILSGLASYGFIVQMLRLRRDVREHEAC